MSRVCCLCGKPIPVGSMVVQYGTMDQDGGIVPECEHVDCKAYIHLACGIHTILETAVEKQPR